jgi:hypothetical protein
LGGGGGGGWGLLVGGGMMKSLQLRADGGSIDLLLIQDDGGEAQLEHAEGCTLGALCQSGGGERVLGGEEEFAEDEGEGGFELGGGETGGVGAAAGAGGVGEGAAAGGEEVGLAHAEDGADGDLEGDLVDEADGADLEHGDVQGVAEGTEAAAGHAEGSKRFEEVVFGVEMGAGAHCDHGKAGFLDGLLGSRHRWE